MVDLRNLEALVRVARLGDVRATAGKLNARGFERLGYAEGMLQFRADMAPGSPRR